MCGTCGCGEESTEDPRMVDLEERVLSRNDHVAAHNRQWLRSRGVLAVNLMSSPGSGKTTLLERTVRESHLPMAVVEGDQATRFDADRIAATGAPVLQVNTGAGCHLDADMLRRGLSDLAPEHGSVVVIENVGNLVCPALFDLGEDARVVVMSVTEGVDKPLKYPHMFTSSDVVLLNKIDLLPHVDFDLATFAEHVRRVRPPVEVVPLSATTGEGLSDWHDWLRDRQHRLTGPPLQGASGSRV